MKAFYIIFFLFRCYFYYIIRGYLSFSKALLTLDNPFSLSLFYICRLKVPITFQLTLLLLMSKHLIILFSQHWIIQYSISVKKNYCMLLSVRNLGLLFTFIWMNLPCFQSKSLGDILLRIILGNSNDLIIIFTHLVSTVIILKIFSSFFYNKINYNSHEGF